MRAWTAADALVVLRTPAEGMVPGRPGLAVGLVGRDRPRGPEPTRRRCVCRALHNNTLPHNRGVVPPAEPERAVAAIRRRSSRRRGRRPSPRLCLFRQRPQPGHLLLLLRLGQPLRLGRRSSLPPPRLGRADHCRDRLHLRVPVNLSGHRGIKEMMQPCTLCLHVISLVALSAVGPAEPPR